MERSYNSPPQNPLSPNTVEWIRLCKKLYDRITDPELRDLLHEFIMVDLKVCEEEKRAAYEQGLAARENK